MKTSERYQQPGLPLMESELTPFVADSPAKTSALREEVRDSTAHEAVYGQNTIALLASYDQTSSSWKTSQLCLDGDLAEFSEIWPRSGMMRSGIAYLRPTLAPDNFGTEFGLWPTPNATAFKGGSYLAKAWSSETRTEQLARLVQPCAWPTISSARDCGTGHGIPYGTHRNKGLGNAVVPQFPELIGYALRTAANDNKQDFNAAAA